MSSHLRERSYVACPSAQAKHHLAEFFREHSANGTVRLTLRVPPAMLDAPTLEADVVATLTPVECEQAIEKLHVSWTPVAGPYPSFEGTLTAREDERYESFVLELEGTYEPPFGLIGVAFDAVVGRRLAMATARELLADIANSVEAQFLESEELKAGKRARGAAAATV